MSFAVGNKFQLCNNGDIASASASLSYLFNLYFQFGGTTTVARVSKYELCQIGDQVEFVFVPHRMHFFDCETEETIV